MKRKVLLTTTVGYVFAVLLVVEAIAWAASKDSEGIALLKDFGGFLMFIIPIIVASIFLRKWVEKRAKNFYNQGIKLSSEGKNREALKMFLKSLERWNLELTHHFTPATIANDLNKLEKVVDQITKHTTLLNETVNTDNIHSYIKIINEENKKKGTRWFKNPAGMREIKSLYKERKQMITDVKKILEF